ncbi:hypothetical protein OSB04_028126 [Centaurea solstitialis]|uniref:Uncharacterized protein n=1 Tax=Centaurea solstitialis TaxID=347529 RepID=A0AA38SF44_9ASTR|nr:hypothetical protein OSB04_028126 [Centaurea solstitialis]
MTIRRSCRTMVWTHQNRCWLLSNCVQSDLYDLALQMVKDCQELSSDECVLGVLAQKAYAFHRRKPWIIQRTILSCRQLYFFMKIYMLRFLLVIFVLVKLVYDFWWLFSSCAAIALKDEYLEKDSDALQLLKIIWKNIAKKA